MLVYAEIIWLDSCSEKSLYWNIQDQSVDEFTLNSITNQFNWSISQPVSLSLSLLLPSLPSCVYHAHTHARTHALSVSLSLSLSL